MKSYNSFDDEVKALIKELEIKLKKMMNKTLEKIKVVTAYIHSNFNAFGKNLMISV